MSERRSSSIQGGPSSWQGNVVSGNARVQNGHHYGDATYNITYPGAAPPSLREQILDSLWFDMMEARQDSIKGATPETLDWIYETDSEDSQNSDSEDHDEQDSDDRDQDEQDSYSGARDSQDSSSGDQDEPDQNYVQAEQDQRSGYHRERAWDNFTKWLKEDNSIYWVCGKAGSGKSTSMAHIVDDDRTSDRLSKWAKEKPLHILSFFFWRPGTELQKSVTGLLRALLYQLCAEVEDLGPQVVKTLRCNPSRRAPWTDKRLNLALEAALSSSDEAFCFLLDGLDEFFGDLSILMDLVYQLQALENVKLCISSRPEAELTASFSSCKQLRLEHLNRADIKKFVKYQLHRLRDKPVFATIELQTFSIFVRQVVNRTEGVFLWAVLVLPTILRGIASGDDWDMLQTRLDMTPTAIDDLYASMLTNLDPIHRESFYFYLELMRILGKGRHDDIMGMPNASVAQITAAQLGEDLLNMSYDDFLRACDLERLRITSRSAGLL